MAFVALALAALLGVAAALTPDRQGFGTHQQLGLPECSFRLLFDRPCPACGMTTSFSHFTHGQWRLAARANPAGFLLALTSLLVCLYLLGAVVTGRQWLLNDPLALVTYSLIAILVYAALVWAWRLF